MPPESTGEAGGSLVFCPDCDTDVDMINGVKQCPHGKRPENAEEYVELMLGYIEADNSNAGK